MDLPDNYIDCVITSPPYWGLRDYGEETVTVWDGDVDCEHEWGEKLKVLHESHNFTDPQKIWRPSGVEKEKIKAKGSAFCVLCEAWKGQLGLEPHPNLYIQHMQQVCREIKRVLKGTGTFWLNMGDTYFSSRSHSDWSGTVDKNWFAGNKGESHKFNVKRTKQRSNWLQPKQKMLIPERTAITLQNDGWILRNTIIWHKPNHMPSSVKDRFTNAYESVFMFAKKRRYYFDLDSVRKPHVWAKKDNRSKLRRVEGKQGKITTGSYATNAVGYNPAGKNPSDLWKINTQPFKEAHFATFPMKLVTRIIKCATAREAVVLDPFCGSGTTLLAARKLLRNYIGFDLNPDYCEMARKRLAKIPARLDTLIPTLKEAKR